MDSALDSALGPPGAMVERRDDLTPMMRQYVACCERYDDSLVLFHVGDFYKTFCGAAETVARLCELTLTEREDNSGTYAMAGIPVDRAESYVETLLDAGYRVAIAEQVEDPEAVTGVAKRAVTRVVTPGTLTEAELLDARDNNFVACLTAAGGDSGDSESDASDGGFGLAMLDVSTGEFYATGPSTESAVRDEVGRFAPTEAIVGPGVPADLAREVFEGDCVVTPFEARAFDPDAADELVADYFGPPDALLAGPTEVRACGALLAYAEYARGGEAGRLDYLTRLTRYDPREHLLVDRVALRSLELFEPRSVHGREDATLVDVLDETASALGSRKLKDWLRRPLLDEARIEARLDAVEELTHTVQVRERLHDRLREVYDLERLISRVSRSRANARDLRSLAATLDEVPEIEATLADAESGKLRTLRDDLDDLAEIRDLVGRAIRDDPPVELTEGGLIRRGYDDDLDDLRATERDGKDWIASLEAGERERTGIDSLKVGYNEVHGYYVEVTRPNLDRVPEEYVRRQTLKNAERFYTPELKEREDEIVQAAARADDLEYRLFCEVRDRVAAETGRVQALAATLAELDVLVALAEVAAKHGYTRPEVGADTIEIREGRHPVVERAEDRFVPNDAVLDRDGFLAVVTGPNMSGKSTYMRQVALVCLLAQVGSFVPASEARLPLLDRVFTRVGASDDIAGGRSTFMVEMTELATILRDATADSLVLLDEVGRGTSTTDGLAIARAVTEHLHDEVGAWTLFATHHHDLTGLEAALDGVVTLHFAARQDGDDVVFDHEVTPGAARASYGVEVARQAGVPEPVVRRSHELVADDRGPDCRDSAAAPAHGDAEGAMANGGELADSTADPPADRLDDPDVAAVLADLRDLPLAETTPLEALNALGRLQARLDGDD